jgi:hypothetical protein
MNKLTFGTKLSNGVAFAAGTIAHVAIATFAARTTLLYGASVITRAKHIISTNGRVWNDSAYNKFIRTEK